MAYEYTRKEIIEMRGKLKAQQRAASMRRRAEYLNHKYTIKVQHQIAKRILERI